MSDYISLNEIKVSIDFGDKIISVGRLAARSGKIYFEYDAGFISSNLNISPIKLPLQAGVKTFDPFLFEGLPGVFNDSLPDGWGRLLLDRLMRSKNILREAISPLDRLAYVGHTGIGALIYVPDYDEKPKSVSINLDILSEQTKEVIDGGAGDVLQELISLNGSSAGARPKVVVGIDNSRNKIIHGQEKLPDNFEHWMVKFANSLDGVDAGAIEYVYSLMAKKAGLDMMDTHLFPAIW